MYSICVCFTLCTNTIANKLPHWHIESATTAGFTLEELNYNSIFLYRWRLRLRLNRDVELMWPGAEGSLTGE